ncbi:hypothetical protein [Sphingobacterium griseoflavum]|uniref:Uncharacterized protein n=1 Tax=Sphingobacterium griseoflavum TaxID=1474952 RepID=A0ABQ3HVW6_9SPHI|nr:hypothetical protein [Sphingobacterium griseoflavum]GHE39792.1 hypothetical protein GCM10017764_23890 [Sphingobacterium griseoflavum]
MFKLLQYLFLTILVSFYYFPIGLSILPSSLNTKNVLALAGIVLLLYSSMRSKRYAISLDLIGAIGLAVFFSMVCLYATDVNHTVDYAYANYYISFAVWLFGAYAVCTAIRLVHGEANFKLITLYLTAVCFGQCVSAILIDRIPSFQILVDTYVSQGQEFFEEVDRLYGIGAALDTAGVRFSLVLVMLSALLVQDAAIRKHAGKVTLLLLAFFTITLIGNMMARTTILGFAMALAYLGIATGVWRMVIQQRFFTFFLIFLLILVLGISISVYLYQTDEAFHDNMRFAFEGFFNWVEKGEWRTDSTDKLNREMWVWPTDTKTWIIGSGLFDNFVYSTDIGYCRFILYCGLTGFSVFALFFVYNSYVFAQRNQRYALMFFFFLAITFVIWVKVATDIFVIYALFYCLDGIETNPFRRQVPAQTPLSPAT